MKKGRGRTEIVIGILLIVTAFSVSAFLHSKGAWKGDNPIAGVNQERSHIPVTGENYTLNYEQEEAYQKEKTQQEERIKQLQQEPVPEEISEESEPVKSPVLESGNDADVSESNPGDSMGGTAGGGGEGEGEGTGGGQAGGEDEKSKLPTITCSLTEGQQVSGMFLGFTVEAVSYKNVQLDAFYLTVMVNGNKLYSSGNQNGVISYHTSQELQDGTNEVTVTAVDKEGYTAVKTYHVIVNAEEAKKEGGTMVVSLRADVLGLGTVFRESVTFYEGENLPYVIDRAFSQAGVTYRHTGTFDYGFYLQRVYKPGITNGYQIPGRFFKN